jgi:hypothetical protein
MYSITEHIYYSQLSSVAILLQPEPVSHRIMQGNDCVLSPCVLSSCGLPFPPTCLLLTVNEARSYFASTIMFRRLPPHAYTVGPLTSSPAKCKSMLDANVRWAPWNEFLQYEGGQMSARQSLLPVCWILILSEPGTVWTGRRCNVTRKTTHVLWQTSA